MSLTLLAVSINQNGGPTAELLQARGEAQARLHEQAAQAARIRFGSRVFVRAVVEISNYCRENCAYCGMRRSNRELNRYRALPEQLAELIIHHRPASVTDINIQAGEDPVAVREVALPLIRSLRRDTPLGISVCLGILTPALYRELRDAGASMYIMKFEVSDPVRYREFEAPRTLPERLENIRALANTGWHVSSGFIAGLPGQTIEELLGNFDLIKELPLAGCSVSPFIAGEQTPLGGSRPAKSDLALNCMAALRLMRPAWPIPAVSALNLAEPGAGYQRGLAAGANLVTINLTPPELRRDYLLYKRERFIMDEERVLNALSKQGMTPSNTSLVDYLSANQPG